jgi:hypothetical protein
VLFNSATGVLSGTPAPGAAGTYNVTFTATNIAGSVSQKLTLTVLALQSINVTPSNASVSNGTTVQFTAAGTYTDASVRDVSNGVAWTSSKTSVATIAAGGMATSVAQGTTTIQATSGSITGSTKLTVATPTLVSISVSPASPSITSGTTQQFAATGTYTDGTTKTITLSVTWSSSVPTVATIASTGIATAAGTGSSVITAALGSLTGSTTLTVQPALVSLAITPANPVIHVGSTLQLTCTGTYSDNSTRDLTGTATWTQSNSNPATISGTGLATGISAGNTTVKVNVGGITSLTTLTVIP